MEEKPEKAMIKLVKQLSKQTVDRPFDLSVEKLNTLEMFVNGVIDKNLKRNKPYRPHEIVNFFLKSVVTGSVVKTETEFIFCIFLIGTFIGGQNTMLQAERALQNSPLLKDLPAELGGLKKLPKNKTNGEPLKN